MATYEKVNGVWREVWSAHVKVNGEWRDIDIRPRVNGFWRLSHRHTLTSDDIKALRFIYSPNTKIRHDTFFELDPNPKMPVTMTVSGINAGKYSLYPKGVILNYERFGYEEGIRVYDGHLYIELENGCFIDVGRSKNTGRNNDDERYPGPTREIKEVWATNRIKDMDIRMKYYTLYETFRYNMYGWNSFFSTYNFLPENPRIEDSSDRKKYNPEKQLILIPHKRRSNDFVPYARIGICRALKPYETMMGSYGIIDHTIEAITVNGVQKPFSIEVYDK